MSIGGVICLVTPLRLRDLAALEEWARTRTPSPLDQASQSILEAPEGPERDRLVRDCWLAEEALEEGSEFGSAAMSRLVQTEAGIRMVLLLSVATYRPTVTPEDLESILEKATVSEWDALERFAYGIHPYEDLRRWIDPPPPGRVGKSATWAEVYATLQESYPWMSLEAFGSLTLSQYRALANGGKYTPGGVRAGEDKIEYARRRGAFFDQPSPEPVPAKPRKPRKGRKPRREDG